MSSHLHGKAISGAGWPLEVDATKEMVDNERRLSFH